MIFKLWDGLDALYLYSCPRHPEDDHAGCRNMSVTTVQENYIHKVRLLGLLIYVTRIIIVVLICVCLGDDVAVDFQGRNSLSIMLLYFRSPLH